MEYINKYYKPFDYNEGLRRFVSDIKVLTDKKMRGFYKDIVKAFKKL